MLDAPSSISTRQPGRTRSTSQIDRPENKEAPPPPQANTNATNGSGTNETNNDTPAARPTEQNRADARAVANNDPRAAQLRQSIERRVSRAGSGDGDPALAPGAGGKDPALPAAATNTGWTRVDGEAFRRDAEGNVINPTYGDVDQGSLPDCWLMASQAAVAHTDPEYIRDRISRNEDGTFNVRIGDSTQRVTPRFPDQGYADPTPNQQQNTLWPALIERGYAQREGNSYARLDHGNAGTALEALTGRPTTHTTITDSTNLDTLWTTLRDGRTGDHPMVLSTRDSGVSSPLHGDHSYAVLDAYERDGQRYVRVYNPWGTNDNSRTRESMETELRLEDVRANFEGLDVSGG